jgi:hypothetical protein
LLASLIRRRVSACGTHILRVIHGRDARATRQSDLLANRLKAFDLGDRAAWPN